MSDEEIVTIYAVGRRLDAHPDLLERLCVINEIPYAVIEGVRCLERKLEGELTAALAMHRADGKPWSKATTASRLGR